MADIKSVLGELDDRIDTAISRAERAGFYMPAIATALRLKADEMAEKYPDDTNGGLTTE